MQTKNLLKTLLKNSDIDRQTNQQLLIHILQKNHSFLISHDDYELTDDELQSYQKSLDLLKNGKPLAYVLGYQGFWKHDFLVNENTLIPRPDTEILIETVLNYIQENSLSNLKILDLGTGTGCIAVSLAYEKPNTKVIAVDFSKNALEIAKKNAERIGVKNIQFLQSDWFDNIDKQKFDIIVSNPPYIDKDDKHLANLTHEPITALVAENHGLADIETIVGQAKGYLNDTGLLAIEHGYDQAGKVQQIFTHHAFCQIKTVKDYGGNDRVTYGFCSNFNQNLIK